MDEGTERDARVATGGAATAGIATNVLGSAPAGKDPETREPLRLLNKDDFIQAPKAGFIYVDIPEWGGRVKIRGLTARERGKIEDALEKLGMEGIRARLTVMSVVTEEGKAMFTEEDESWLNDMDSAPLDRIYMASAKHSKLGKGDIAAEVGNSAGAR